MVNEHDHSYAWSGEVPCTGVRKCIVCDVHEDEILAIKDQVTVVASVEKGKIRVTMAQGTTQAQQDEIWKRMSQFPHRVRHAFDMNVQATPLQIWRALGAGDGLDDDELCPNTGQKHEPDWGTSSTEDDGEDTYLDVNCLNCGRSGCVGKAIVLAEEISW